MKIFDKSTGIIKMNKMFYEDKKSSDYTPTAYGRELDDECVIDFCLNCNKEDCPGICSDFIEFYKKHKRRNSL